MKKTILITISLVLFHIVNGYSQDISETTISFMDGKQNAVEAKYKYSEDIMQSVVKDVLEKKKLKKTKSVKGFDLYQGIVFEELSADKIDFYVKIDGNKKASTITILISKGYNNFISTSNDASTIKNTKNLCKEFNIYAIESFLNQEIKKQEDVVKEANKKLEKSVDKGKDLVKDKEDIIKKIENNSSEQKDLKAALEEQKKVLSTLKNKK